LEERKSGKLQRNLESYKSKAELKFCRQLYRKKGKKEGKKAKKESVLKDAIANAKLWETKLEAVEKSRQEYR